MHYKILHITANLFDVFWCENKCIAKTGWQNWARVKRNRDSTLIVWKTNTKLPNNFMEKVNENLHS